MSPACPLTPLPHTLARAWPLPAACTCRGLSVGGGRGDGATSSSGERQRIPAAADTPPPPRWGARLATDGAGVAATQCAKTGTAHKEVGLGAPRVSSPSSCAVGGGLQTTWQHRERPRAAKGDSCLFWKLVLAASLPPSGHGALLSCSQPALDITTLTPHCSPSHPPSPEPITPCPPPPPPSSGCPLALCFPRAGWLAPQCRGAGLTSPGGGRQQCQGEKWTPEPPRAWLCSTRPVTLFSRDWPLRMH